jgi:hypothetical protein
MDKEKIKEILISLQKNLFENKTNQLILLGIGAVMVVVMSISILFIVTRFKKTEEIIPTPIPTLIPAIKPTSTQMSVDKIQSASWSINCQVVVKTTQTKKYLRKFSHCAEKLQYIVSPSGNDLAYIYQNEEKKYELSVYSLDNNTEAILEDSLTEILDFKFTADDNLGLLIDQKTFSYYLIPMLYTDYPANYDIQTTSFTNLSQRKTDVVLPEFSSLYASIQEDNGKINLLSDTNKILYSISIKDLINQIIPQAQKNPKEKYNWQNRVLYIDNNEIKSINTEGFAMETHKIVCDSTEVSASEIQSSVTARSPDGTQLAFVLPSSGVIAIFDLIKDECEVTGIIQSHDYHENIAFSPDGQYLAYVNKGLGIYKLRDKQNNQVLSYSPDNSENPLVITGPLEWSSDSRFICFALSKAEGDSVTKQYVLSNTQLVRAYFSSSFEGKEQTVIPLTSSSTNYVCSPDSQKAIYNKNNAWFLYSLQNKQNSLFKTQKSSETDNKIIWSTSGKIITNSWSSNEAQRFTDILLGADFSIDQSGNVAAYSDADGTIKFYDLINNKIITPVNGKTITGKLLLFFH